jgi:hypothetical protein
MTVLKGQFYTKVLLQGVAHRVAGQHPQQLSTCLFAWRGNLVIDEALIGSGESICQTLEKLPCIFAGISALHLHIAFLM